MGGKIGSEHTNSVYSTSDGVTWSLVTQAAGWTARSGLVALTFQLKYDIEVLEHTLTVTDFT